MPEDKFDELMAMVAEGSEAIHKRLDDLDQKQHERFTNLELRLGRLENRMGRIEDKLDAEQQFTS